MVLFDEDPVELIRETTSQFKIHPDRDCLTRISTSLGSLSASRHTRLSTQQTSLKSLSRRLNNLEEGRRWEEDRHDAGGHAERMLKMDTEKFRVAKGVSEGEIEGERLEGELGGLKGVLEGLEREGVEGGRRRSGDEEDATVLKLQIYRSLGISANPDPATGEYSRAVVRRSSHAENGESGKGDVNIVNLDGNLGRGYYTGIVWDSL